VVRPSTPLINRQVAIKAALDIIDSEGLDSISMRRLAERLGVASASLYHHFHNKEELLQAVCGLIFSEIPHPDERTEGWTDLVARTAYTSREIMLQHPNALPLMARFPAREVIPHIYEGFGNLLHKRGLPVDLISVIISAFDALVIGSATLKLDRGQPNIPGSETQPSEPLAEWQRANARTEDEVFRLSCYALADGIAAYIASSTPGPGS
jgi:TetR/AcrR family tetracycline transcriptional repressor